MSAFDSMRYDLKPIQKWLPTLTVERIRGEGRDPLEVNQGVRFLPQAPISSSRGLGVDASKRAVYTARTGASPSVCREPGDDWTVVRLLNLALDMRREGRVLISFDVPLGLPRAYLDAGRKEPRWKHAASFLQWLAVVKTRPCSRARRRARVPGRS